MKIKPSYIFVLLLLVGAFLRLYRLPETMQFLGDQGRDAIIVRRMLIEHHPALIGPVTSVGNMYLGPFYYYFMLLPLMLTYPSPVGPAIAVAFVGILTLILIYKLGKQIVGENGALIATGLFAISPMILTFSRFSWNPNIVPFFSLLLFYALYKAMMGNDRQWLWVSLWFSILVQLHYLTLILGAFCGAAWIFHVLVRAKVKTQWRSLISATLGAIFIFGASLLPLVAFDLRHDFTNSKAFVVFFQNPSGSHNLLPLFFGIFVTFKDLFQRNLLSLYAWRVTGIPSLVFFAGVVILFIWGVRRAKMEYRFVLWLLGAMFLFSNFLLAFYRQTIYDHYLMLFTPMSVLLVGFVLSNLLTLKKMGKALVGLVLMSMVLTSILHTPVTQNLGYNIFMMEKTANAIQTHLASAETYDILVFTDTNDYQGMNYRYFLTTGKIAPASEEKIHEFKSLFILDEQNRHNPVDGPQYKIAMWPNRKVVDSFDISGGPKVFKLVR